MQTQSFSSVGSDRQAKILRGRVFTLISALSLVCCASVSGQDAAEKNAKLVAPFFGETTIVLIRVDADQLSLDKLAGPLKIDSLGPDAVTAFEQLKAQFAEGIKELRSLSNGQPLWASIGIPVSKTQPQTFLFRLAKSPNDAVQTIQRLKDRNLSARRSGDYIVASSTGGEEGVRQATRDQKELVAAFDSVTGYPVQVLIIPPSHIWRTVDELSPTLPKQLGGGPSSVLTRGLKWAGIGVDPSRLRISATIQSDDPDAAQKFAAHLPLMLSNLYDSTPNKPAVPAPAVRLLLDWLQPKAEGDQVKITVNGLEQTGLNVAVFAGWAKLIGHQTQRHSNREKFKQILLGIHNYHDVFKAIPPAKRHRDKDGKPRLSWRVHLLPFVEQGPLYSQFKLDEPWDSPHNKQLISKMPPIYSSRSVPLEQRRAGRTTFVAPQGEKTAFGGDKVVSFSNVVDGLSNTVVLVEAKPSHSVIWTKPDDYQFENNDPLQGVLIDAQKQWLCAMGDGSVQQLPATLPAQTVLHLFQMNDGHRIDLPR